MLLNKICKKCKTSFSYKSYYNRTYCSRACQMADNLYKGRGKLRNYESITGSNNYAWKGQGVSYFGLHAWVKRRLGAPAKCDQCGSTKITRYEWANKSHEYKRDLTDWLRLCRSCHNKYDDIVNKGWITRRASA